MKIFLTAVTPTIDSQIDPRFGRAAYFIAVDTDTLAWQAHPNPAVGAAGGAGSWAAQFIASHQADAVISGDFGPNAYNALHAGEIRMYLFGASATVREAILNYKAGKLALVAAPIGVGHHHRG